MDLTIPLYLMIISIMTDSILGLRCWHCFGDQCDLEPRDNDKAKITACGDGQVCQKTYFEMYNEEEQQSYISTVRSCARVCKERNDFINCTFRTKSTLGCVRKDCCHSKSLCNGSDVIKNHWIGILIMCLFIVL